MIYNRNLIPNYSQKFNKIEIIEIILTYKEHCIESIAHFRYGYPKLKKID